VVDLPEIRCPSCNHVYKIVNDFLMVLSEKEDGTKEVIDVRTIKGMTCTYCPAPGHGFIWIPCFEGMQPRRMSIEEELRYEGY
jgi:hypothetical protein